MNPLRKHYLNCHVPVCSSFFCRFAPRNDRQREQYIEQKYGMTRCPYEWEISAVKS